MPANNRLQRALGKQKGVTMDAEVDVSRKYAFVLRPEAVTRIWAVLKKVGDVPVTASCQDDTERQITDPKRLLDFENPKVKQIRGLTFSAFGDDRQRSVHLRRRKEARRVDDGQNEIGHTAAVRAGSGCTRRDDAHVRVRAGVRVYERAA